MAANEPVVIMLTPKEMREVQRRARALGLNVSEYLRKVLIGDDEDVKLEELLERTKTAAQQSIAVIDETLAFVNASNARIEAKKAAL